MSQLLPFQNDEALLQALRAETPAAFEALYRRYYRMVARQVFNQGRADLNAEDVFQELLVILVGKVRMPDFQLTAKLSTFMFAIARNLIYKKTDNKTQLTANAQLFADAAYLPEAETAEARKLQEDQLNVVVGSLELLEDDCRRLLRMSFYEKRPQAEIAAEMGYSEAFVKVKKHRCLNYLRNRVQEHPLFKTRQNKAS